MPRPERPLDPGDSALLRFAAELRLLRNKAGNPTYRALAASTHYSATVLSEAAGGRRLPSLAVTLAYAAACGADPEEWRARWHEVAAEPAGTANNPADPENPVTPAPYVGLAAFQPGDADRFFGRERMVDEVSALIGEHRVLGVFGASGTGKSSLLRAGVLARARSAGRPTLLFTPGRHPLTECAIAFAALTGGSATGLRAEFTGAADNLHLRIRQYLADRPPGSDLLVVVDQFEEIFTEADEAERAGFVTALLAAAGAADSRIRIVLGIRADFHGHCGRYPDLVVALRAGQFHLGPMTPDELRQAIVRPGMLAGCTVESALVSRLIADATGEPAVLPLISHALLETWRRRRGTRLTLAGYDETGGIHNAIADSAETVFAGLSRTQQDVARQVLLRLTALGDNTGNTGDTRRRISRANLDNDHPDTAFVLEQLAAARLVALDQDTVELSHEALIRCWPRLREWLDEDRAGLRVHHQLADDTGTWLALGRDPGSLYRGVRLMTAANWATANPTALTRPEREFLDAGRSAELAERAAAQRRTRRSRQLLVLLSVLLLLTTAATVLAARATVAERRQRDIAVARQVVAQAATLHLTNPALAEQLGLAAYRLAPLPEARDALLSSSSLPYAARLPGAPTEAVSARFSPDGRTLATADTDNTVRLWNTTNPQRPTAITVLHGHTGNAARPESTAGPHRSAPITVLHGHNDALWSVAFSPDGHILAAAGDDETVRLWNTTNPRQPTPITVLHGHTQSVRSVAFSPDGHTLATAGDDETVRLWNTTNPRQPTPITVLHGHTQSVRSVAFNPDGHTLATAGTDNTVRLWDTRNGTTLAVLRGHRDAVNSVTFSPDGRTLASASGDRSAALWDVTDPRTPRLLHRLVGHTEEVLSAAFSPDGRTLATAGIDRTVRLWNTADGRELATFGGHTNNVYCAVFSPDGRTLVTTGADDTVQLLRIPPFVLGGHADGIGSVAYRRDGRIVVTAGDDGTARLWGMPAGTELATITGHTGTVNSARFSPDGRLVATAGDDHTTRLWDVADPAAPRPVATITAGNDPVYSAKFSPDGRLLAATSTDAVRVWDVTDPRTPHRIATIRGTGYLITSVSWSPDGRTLSAAADDHTARLWDVTDPARPRRLAVLRGHGDAVTQTTFSPDGRMLATMSWDHTTWLWDVGDLRRPVHLSTLVGHTDNVTTARFSPDGHQLATASSDSTVRLWDVTDPHAPTETAVLTGHTAVVRALAYDATGGTLITASNDGTVRSWATDITRAVEHICAVAYPRITRAEWQHYLPGIDYQPPCGRAG